MALPPERPASPSSALADPSPSARIEAIEDALAAAGLQQRPIGVVDLDAFEANAADLARRAVGTPIRVASKSLRVRALLERAAATPGFRGVLAFTLPEALWLHAHGFEDILVAYPSADAAALEALAGSAGARRAITLMVDCPAHLDLIGAAAQAAPHVGRAGADLSPLRVAIELDAAYAPARGIRFGALRSPLATAEGVAALARRIAAMPQLALVGLMAYEGQIAGVADAAPTPYGLAVRAMKRFSRSEIARRRAAAVAAVQELAELEIVNAGGTGSIESSCAEPVVTEVAAGSGLMGAALFDAYRGFRPRPALLLGFSVVRRPGREVATLLGGGWIASGPPAADRVPTIHAPAGLRFAPQEGAGEVQTPVLGAAAERLRVGDTVWLRHAKSGEPAEHLNEYALVRGGDVLDVVPTYRGEGRAFL